MRVRTRVRLWPCTERLAHVSAHTVSVHWRRVKRAVLPETDTPLARAPRLSRRVLGARYRPSALVGGCPTLTARGARPSR